MVPGAGSSKLFGGPDPGAHPDPIRGVFPMRRTLAAGSVGFVLAAGLAIAMGSRPPLHASPAPVEPMGGFGGQAEEPLQPGAIVHLAARPMSPEATRLWLKLQQKVDMQFPNDTPLEDVVRYIQQ